MENQPAAGRQWFRLASQARMEPPPPAPLPAPAGPQQRRGPPIRQASIALAMSNLALDTVTPVPEPPQTQSNTLPSPFLQVAAPPPPEAAAPAPALTPFSDVEPPKEPMPPASVQSTTMTPSRTITPPTSITLPRTITPPTEPVPQETRTPPPVIIPPRTVRPPPMTMTLPRTITPPTEPIPPKAQTPPRTITPPRIITPSTTMTLPRTLTPPKEPVPPKTQTPPPVPEVIYKESTPAPAAETPTPATPLPTATILSPVQPPLARPPSTRNGNGNYSNLGKPSMLASDAMPVILSPIATKARTPPESPKVIKASSPTPPQSPNIKPATNLNPSSESEPRALFSPQPKSIGLQDNPERNNGEQGELQKFIKQQAEARNGPPPSPMKEEKQATRPNGKAFATRKDDKRIITIAGENYGAIMDLGSDHQLHGRKSHVHHLKSHEVQSGRDDGKSSNMPNATSKAKLMMFLTNSNVQCVNNSIMSNASSVNRSPGVHINFTKRHQTNTTSSIPEGSHQPLH